MDGLVTAYSITQRKIAVWCGALRNEGNHALQPAKLYHALLCVACCIPVLTHLDFISFLRYENATGCNVTL